MLALFIGSWIVALIFLPQAGSEHSSGADSAAPQLIAEVVFFALGFVVGIGGFTHTHKPYSVAKPGRRSPRAW